MELTQISTDFKGWTEKGLHSRFRVKFPKNFPRVRIHIFYITKPASFCNQPYPNLGMERPHVDVVRFFRWKWRCSPQRFFSIKLSKSARLIFLSTGANLRLLELTHLPCRAKTSRSKFVLAIFRRDLQKVYQTNWIDPHIISIPC